MNTRNTVVILASVFLLSSLAQATPRRRAQKKVLRARQISGLVRAAMAQRHAGAQGPVARLISRVQRERDPALHRLGVFSLLRQKMPLLREQKKAILKMVRDPSRGLLPSQPPIPKTGKVEVRHYAMSGFLDKDLEQMAAAGFTVRRTSEGAEATRGRFHVIARETSTNILRDLADSKVNLIIYNGHSQIGGTVEEALLTPMKQPRGRKLVALFQCVGTQTLPMIRGRAPGADVITSKQPLFVAETPYLMRALYEGLDKGDSYHALRRRLDKASWGKDRLVFPNQTASLKHTDFDINGVLDVNQAPGAIEVLRGRERNAAKGLLSGVQFLRTMNPYYAGETPGAVFTKGQASFPLISMGLGQGEARGRSVTRITERHDKGQRRFTVTIDPAFRTAARHFVGAETVFELQMHLQRRLTGKSGDRAKVRALAFTGEYLALIPRNIHQAQNALNRVTQMNGLPRLNIWDVRNAIAGDHVISEEQVDKLQNLITRARQAPSRL